MSKKVVIDIEECRTMNFQGKSKYGVLVRFSYMPPILPIYIGVCLSIIYNFILNTSDRTSQYYH